MHIVVSNFVFINFVLYVCVWFFLYSIYVVLLFLFACFLKGEKEGMWSLLDGKVAGI